MAEGDWRKPKSESLEDFVKWVLKIALWVALIVATWRYALNGDPSLPPWESLPLL